MKREFLQELRVGEQPLPKEVVDAIMAEHGKDIQHHREQAQNWEQKYNSAVSAHSAELSELAFAATLERGVTRHGGRNLKAISAVLDLEKIRAEQDVEAALEEALTDLKQEHDYLFARTQTPPPYAGGTGTASAVPQSPSTLVGALKERFANYESHGYL